MYIIHIKPMSLCNIANVCLGVYKQYTYIRIHHITSLYSCVLTFCKNASTMAVCSMDSTSGPRFMDMSGLVELTSRGSSVESSCSDELFVCTTEKVEIKPVHQDNCSKEQLFQMIMRMVYNGTVNS